MYTKRSRVTFRRLEVVLLGFVFFAVLLFMKHFAVDNAGGSDSYGYLAEALRLSQGHLYEAEEVFSRFGLSEDAHLTHPLGMLPYGDQGTIPSYPAGYPILMVPLIWWLGQPGAFWVTPVLAAGTVVLTYLLARQLIGRVAGIIAAGLVFICPAFMRFGFDMMSDVPATFFATLSLLLLAVPGAVTVDLLLGASLGAGFWIRPNMVLLVPPVLCWLAFKADWTRLLRVCLAISVFVLALALYNWALFDAPWKTGYGSPGLDTEFQLVTERGLRYLWRLNTQQAGVGLLLFGLSIFVNQLTIQLRLLLLVICVIFGVFFASYPVDDAWWYFRFLLPIYPIIAVLEAGMLVSLIQPGRLRFLRTAALSVGLVAFVAGSLQFSLHNTVFTLSPVERKYKRIAERVQSEVTGPAVLVAMQHSGALRLYTDYPTLRYDHPFEQVYKHLSAIEQAGGAVYLVLEDWEYASLAEWWVSSDFDVPALIGQMKKIETIEEDKVSLYEWKIGSAPGN